MMTSIEALSLAHVHLENLSSLVTAVAEIIGCGFVACPPQLLVDSLSIDSTDHFSCVTIVQLCHLVLGEILLHLKTIHRHTLARKDLAPLQLRFIDVFFSCFIVSVFFVEMNFGDLVIFVSTRVYSPYVIGVTCNVAVNIIGTWARSLRGV